MRKNYFLPQTEIIPHITVMECMQNTIMNITPHIENPLDDDTVH